MAKTKRRSFKSSKPKPKRQKVRHGYSSVARTRGAAVTGEMKYFDTLRSAAAIAASADWTGTELDPTTYNTLLAPIVGSGVDQRIGKSVKVLKIKIRGSITSNHQINQTAGRDPQFVRLILHQDKQTNSTQAQGEDVMANAGSAILNVHSFQNVNNFGRFRVLKDKVFIIENPNMSYDGTNIETQGIVKYFKWTVKFKYPVMIRFNATNGGTVADIVDNSFHIIANSSDANLASVLTYQSRVCYKE